MVNECKNQTQKVQVPFRGDFIRAIKPIGVLNSVKSIELVVEKNGIEITRKTLICTNGEYEINGEFGVPLLDFPLEYFVIIHYHPMCNAPKKRCNFGLAQTSRLNGLALDFIFLDEKMDFTIEEVVYLLEK